MLTSPEKKPGQGPEGKIKPEIYDFYFECPNGVKDDYWEGLAEFLRQEKKFIIANYIPKHNQKENTVMIRVMSNINVSEILEIIEKWIDKTGTPAGLRLISLKAQTSQ